MAINEWAEALHGSDDSLDLARLAFLIARGEFPELDIDEQLERLDTLASEISIGDAGLEGLRQLLFETHGFRGNEQDYYDAGNSYLNIVLDRHVGIPISLSLLYLEIGWRIGLDLAPISFPGHFLLRYRGPIATSDDATSDDANGIKPTEKTSQSPQLIALPLMPKEHSTTTTHSDEVFVDVFHGAVLQTRAQLTQRLSQVLGRQLPAGFDTTRVFEPCSRREIVARILRNLKQIYLQQDDTERALRISDQILHVEPALASHYRDRGVLYGRVGHNEAALADYRRYLAMVPKAPDADRIRKLLVRAASQTRPLN